MPDPTKKSAWAKAGTIIGVVTGILTIVVMCVGAIAWSANEHTKVSTNTENIKELTDLHQAALQHRHQMMIECKARYDVVENDIGDIKRDIAVQGKDIEYIRQAVDRIAP